MNPKRIFTSPYFLTFLSALFIVLSFPPYNVVLFIPFALIPWLYALNHARNWKSRLKLGILLSVLMTVMGFHWVAYVLQEFAQLNVVVSWFCVLLYGLGAQPQFPIYALLRHRFPLPARAALYVAIDFLIPKLFRDSLGHSFHALASIQQFSELTGVFGLTFWIIFTAEAGLLFLERKYRPLLVSLGLFLAMFAWGHFRLENVRAQIEEAKSRGDVTRFALIQANIGDPDKFAARAGLDGAAQAVVDRYLRISQEAIKAANAQGTRLDAIVWPETAYPSLFRHPVTFSETYRDSQLEKLSEESKIPLHFGGYDTHLGRDANTIFFLSEQGSLTAYHKNILLPFGEELPFLSVFPSLKMMFPQVGNFSRGPGPLTMEVPLTDGKQIPVTPLICYEVLDGNYVRKGVKDGAKLLLNVTNDSWFGPWGEPHLHLALSTFRSVETRLTLVRATNTGFSAVVLPDGSISQRSSLNEESFLFAEAPHEIRPLRYGVMLWGDAFAWICVFISALTLIICLRLRQTQGLLPDLKGKKS